MKLKSFVLVLVLFVVGCASQTYVVHPGAVNVFDSQSYDTLLVTHSVIESTKADLAAGKFPGSVGTSVSTALNALVTSYNVADTAYLTYHAAASAGTLTAVQQTSLTSALDNVNVATTNLTSAKAGQ
jgi:hypothetical protein